jgi:hypothetical protein
MIDNVDFEMLVEAIEVRLYHGSERNLRVLKPDAINVGTRLSSPRWSIFFWRDPARAANWAVFSLLRSIFRDKERRRGLGLTELAYDPVLGKAVVIRAEVATWKKVVARRIVYVYEVDVPPWKIGLGHSSTIEEYTVDEETEYNSRRAIQVTDAVFDSSVVVVADRDALIAYVDNLWKRIPQRTGAMLMKPDYFDTFNALSRKYAHGEIQPGDKLTL